MTYFYKPNNTFVKVIVVFLIFLSNQSFQAQQLAFPTAYGAGAYTTGGRGGIIVHVTNLNSSGAGSLKEAIEFYGNTPRIIVFDVSGVINLTSMIYASNANSNFTILGQTAPEGGITIDGDRVYFENVDNIIIRHIRIKGGTDGDLIPGSGDGQGTSSFVSAGGATNQIFDHVSLAFGNDETAEWYTTQNQDVDKITIQKCFYSQGLKGGIVGKGINKTGLYGDISFINNLFYNNSYRFPNVIGEGKIDLINNVIWKVGGRLTNSTGTLTLNHIGNYYNYGNYPITDISINLHSEGPIPQIYTSGNKIIAPNFTLPLTSTVEEMNTDNTLMWKYFVGNNWGNQLPDNHFANTQTFLGGRTPNIVDADTAFSNALNDIGCNARLNADGSVSSNQDVLETDYLDQMSLGNFVAKLERSEWNVPPITTVSRPVNYYVNSTDIPEVWFSANVPNGEVSTDFAPSGYMWIEEFANQVDSVNSVATENVEVTPNISDLQILESISLIATFNPVNASNQTGVWSSSDESIATVDVNGVVTAMSVGVVTVSFTANDGGFSDTSEITVFPEALVASAGEDQQICEGESTTLTASGGTNYVWNTGEITETIEITPVETTTYTVTVSDESGQSDEASVIVTVHSFPAADAGEDQTICEGESIVLTASGGTSYLWSNGESTDSIEVNPSIETTYNVEVITNNCSSTDSVTIFVSEAPDITISEDIVIVEGETTTLTANGSDNYEWSTNEITESITVSPLVTTTYTVSSIGINGCSSSLDVIVTVIPEVVAEAGEDVTICSGETVTLNASGGVTYTWDTGDTGSELIDSPTITTTYIVTVEDDYGYTDSDSITVFVNEIPDIVVDEEVYVMIGNSVTISAAGGDTYTWSTGETTASISVSPDVTTTYTVTGFSINGCQSTADVLVTVVEELSANAGEDVSICIGESITLGASGGVTYTWNTGDTGTSPTFSPTETTIYTVTVTDGFGNSDSDDITITVNPLPTAYAGEDQTVCVGEPVTLMATGGDTYLWSTGDTSASITVIPITDTVYTVEVFTNNCSDTDDVTLFTLQGPNVTVSEDITIMTGDFTTLTASGGETYSWNTGETTNTISVSPADTTTYTVTGFSANGCQSSKQVTVTVIPELIANAGSDVTICNGESVTLNASGGVTYSWNNGVTGASPTLNPTVTTTYTVTVTDDYGNSDSDSVTITVNELPDVSVSENITIIEGESTNLVVNGAETYLWNTGETSNIINVSPTQTTIYTVTGTSNTCSVQVQVTVTIEELFVASAGTDENVCDNESYDVVLTANQGDSYLWSTGETTQSILVSPLSTTEYTVVVTQGTQEDTDDVTVFVNPSPIVEISNGDSVEILNGDFITLSALGANTYEWNNGASQPNIAVSPSTTTIYEVRGFVGNCYDEKQVTVNVLQPVVADAGEDVLICLDEVVSLTATGGDEYVWSTGETTQTILVSPTETTDYTVTVFNALDFDEASVRVEVDTNCEVEPIEPPVEELLDFSFDIFPNPAFNIVNVKLSGTLIGSEVYIYDFTGKLIRRTKISNEDLSPITTTRIDISELQTGVYFVKLIDQDRDVTKKLIVK